MLGLQDGAAVCRGMAPVHCVIRSLGKDFETHGDLATDQIAGQILKLGVRQIRKIISHWPRLLAYLLSSQAIESPTARCLSFTNKKINPPFRTIR